MNQIEGSPTRLSGQQKITSHHLERLACVYIRQSSREQVLRHQGSQINQYQLVQRAAALGWAVDRIQVIDTDLGQSARESASRSGFKELVAEVSLGHVGLILGYEVSRLARNNADWYTLLDLAAVFHTLIADTDGVYDPRLYNDRLLLGLKGTMSEAELHLLKLRLEAGRLRQIERGQYRQQLPTGLVRLDDGTVVKDPDDQVRHTLELVLTKFEEVGSCRQVLLYLRQAKLLLPRRQTHGPQRGEVVWKQPSHAAVYGILTNPAYAGAFAYGRVQLDPSRRQPGRKDTGFVRQPLTAWTHLQHDVYPAYLSWAQYLANQERLRQNATRFREDIERGQGMPRQGEALLQGLAVCGYCAHRLEVSYKPLHRYICKELAHELGEPMCASFAGPCVDEVVVQTFFEAIAPTQLDVLEVVLAEQAAEQARLNQHWQERLKRAEYEAGLAQRRYNQVDPDNRLVAAELEQQWEEKLRHWQTSREAYERFQQTSAGPTLSPEQQDQFRHMSTTLPSLWRTGQLSHAQQKELLRSLITKIILRRAEENTIEVRIVWLSGHYSIVYARPPVYRTRRLAKYEELVARIQTLWQQGLADEQIARQLTGEGFRSPRSLDLNPKTVQRIRLAYCWKRPHPSSTRRLELAGYLTITELAQRLGTNQTWIYRRIRQHRIEAAYVKPHPRYKALMVQDDPVLLAQLRQELASGRSGG
jgi:DNA invertase Pin-like site-specific DNA recombinase